MKPFSLFKLQDLAEGYKAHAEEPTVDGFLLYIRERLYQRAKYSPAEIERFRLLYPHEKISVIALLMGRSENALNQLANRLGLRKRGEFNRRIY